MPWLIGIDEAGYGPNLGPLVMTAVACRVHDRLAAADLWPLLCSAVRRHGDLADERLLIEDSKLVYSSARGLTALELGVLGTVLARSNEAEPLHPLLQRICPDSVPDLGREPWYTGMSAVPVAAEANACAAASARFSQASADAQISWEAVCSVVLCPARFNEVLDHFGSKGAVLGHALGRLLSACRDLAPVDEPQCFFVDKHGGRDHYAPMLQDALQEGLVVAHEEGRQRSVYRVVGARRPMQLTIWPRADGEHFCVALASMVSKYVRELLMREFNQFWLGHVPGLKPTAGYPGDAARYYTAIRPAAERLRIPETVLWRRR